MVAWLPIEKQESSSLGFGLEAREVVFAEQKFGKCMQSTLLPCLLGPIALSSMKDWVLCDAFRVTQTSSDLQAGFSANRDITF